MSLVHTPPPPVPPNEAISLPSHEEETKCNICEEVMLFDSQECYTLTNCAHIFHRSCIEQSLASSNMQIAMSVV